MLFQDYSNPKSLGSRLRKRRLRIFLDLVRAIISKKGACRILDVGGRVSYWSIIAPELQVLPGVSLTIINVEKPDDTEISLGIPLELHVGDGCSMDFEDCAFDIVHSNSVIEHVGSWRRMVSFADEIRRVGKAVFVQTPYFWFPLEPHVNILGFLSFLVRFSAIF